MQECPPDTLSIDPIQNSWNIPVENNWNEIEVMTWNIKDFPISGNTTINYVNEIITDLLPDIIAFQEINNASSFITLANSIPAYEFISSGSGLALAVRSDIIEITSWTTLFPNEGYDLAWRYPLLVELNWLCGTNSISLQLINIHLKAGSSSSDFDRRYAACVLLSDYIHDNLNSNIIILGDYNDEITDSENSNSLWPLVANNEVAFPTESIANNNYYDSYPSWPSFIDHIAISESLFDELNGSNIKTIRIDDYTGYNNFQNNISDHRPVIWSFLSEEVELTTDLVINEIMHNPNSIADAAGEWIEITNISDAEINLHGLILHDNGGEEHTILNDVLVLPNEFVVLGANNDTAINGNVNIHYEYSDFTLSNLWDEVILSHPSGVIIDEVHYDNGESFPDENGKSMMLLSPNLDNNQGENWSTTNIEYDPGNFGTPGESNYPDDDCTEPLGDINTDNEFNVLDVVALVNCVLEENCDIHGCTADLNSDGIFNVLDIVALVNCVLANNCNS